MAYSNVGKPVFYIDNYLYQRIIGTEFVEFTTSWSYNSEDVPVFSHQTDPNIYTLEPALPTNFGSTETITLGYFLAPWKGTNDSRYVESGNCEFYCALLNHNINGDSGDHFFSVLGIGGDTLTGDTITDEEAMLVSGQKEILNCDIQDSNFNHPSYNGSSILSWDQAMESTFPHLAVGIHNSSGSRSDFSLGAFSSGIKYTMPHSPDLKLSMSIEMDGIESVKTSGGSTFSNVKYSGNPLWTLGRNRTNPFAVYTGYDYDSDSDNPTNYLDVSRSAAQRHGRRTWNLKFSYISDRDLFSSTIRGSQYTQHMTDGTTGSHYHEDDLVEDDNGKKMHHTMETDDSFYAQVWNKTLGGALPFIFQPDSTFNDEFYICKFDQNSLKVKQSAHKVYDISVKIVESW